MHRTFFLDLGLSLTFSGSGRKQLTESFQKRSFLPGVMHIFFSKFVFMVPLDIPCGLDVYWPVCLDHGAFGPILAPFKLTLLRKIKLDGCHFVNLI